MAAERHIDNIDDKISVLILYFAAFCAKMNKPLSKTLLNKFLYNVDFGHYAVHNDQITTFKYKKDHFGPVPTEVGYYLDSLREDNDLSIEVRYNDKANKQYDSFITEYDVDGIPLEEYFTSEEMRTIQATANAFASKTAEKASLESHCQYAWLSSASHTVIPIQSAKYCAFEWLDYFGEGKDAEDYQETKAIREDIQRNYKLKHQMREMVSQKRHFKIIGSNKMV